MTRPRLRTPTRIVAAVAAGALVLSGCSGDEEPTSDTTVVSAPPATDPALSYPVSSDPATPVYIAVGQRFGVALQAESSAGFRWQLSATPDRAVIVGLGSEFLTTSTDVGAPQTQVFSFVAQAEGATTIDLQYVSADGVAVPDADPASFSVTVTVDGQPPPTTTDPDSTETTETTDTTED